MAFREAVLTMAATYPYAMSLAADNGLNNHHCMLIRSLAIFMPLIASACEADTALSLTDGWRTEVMAEWGDVMPDMLAFSADGNTLYVSNETKSGGDNPSLSRIDVATGTCRTLLSGLNRADGLKMDRQGRLWLGEEVTGGRMFRIDIPESLKRNQRLDQSPVPGTVQYVESAGNMAHEGFAFSSDEQYLYLADEWKEGSLFRLDLHSGKLQLLHEQKGWLAIDEPGRARERAIQAKGRPFHRLEDMETLPDGRILLAETGDSNRRGRIWVLDDRGKKPSMSLYLDHPDLNHPDNLEWDVHRQLLWITDDDWPSFLWAWNGKNLIRVATHRTAEITGIESAPDGSLWFNLQHNKAGADMTIRMTGGFTE